jgi:hypothetical protein
MRSDEPELVDVGARFPAWEAWRGISGLFHARMKGRTPPVIVTGESAEDLMGQIVRWEGLHDRC